MTLNTISNAGIYGRFGPRFKKAFDWLLSRDVASLPAGRVDIVDGEIYALVQRYKTKPVSEGAWEAHRRYADIQYIHSGEETMGWDRLDLCRQGEYVPEKDFLPLETAGGVELRVRAGDFAIFFPQDAHRPGVSDTPGKDVCKVVIKVLAIDPGPESGT